MGHSRAELPGIQQLTVAVGRVLAVAALATGGLACLALLLDLVAASADGRSIASVVALSLLVLAQVVALVRLTLLTADAALAAAFGLAACGLATGIEADISGRGCANWKPVALCSMDHDLLALDATGGLLYGVRPRDNDMCTPDRRPAALLPHAVRAR